MIEAGLFFIVKLTKLMKLSIINYGLFAFNRTTKSNRCVVAGLLLLAGTMVESVFLKENTAIVFPILDLVFTYLIFDAPLSKSIKAYVIAFLLVEGLDSIIYTLIMKIFNCNIYDITGIEHSGIDILCSLPGLVFWLALIMVLRRKRIYFDFLGKKYGTTLICILTAAFQILVITYIWGGGIHRNVDVTNSVVLILMLSSSVCVAYIFLYLIKVLRVTEFQNQELNLLKRQDELTRKYYMDLYDKEQLEREQRHDLHHFVNYLNECIEERDYDAVERVVKEMNMRSSINSYKYIYSGNKTVDAVIHGTLGRFVDTREILFEYEGKLAQNLGISDMDICVLVSNALENALHACLRCSGEKKILMWAGLKGNVLMIEIENSVEEGSSNMNIDNPHKRDGHGYGLQSMRRVVERYNGEMEWLIKNGRFRLNVCLVGNLL